MLSTRVVAAPAAGTSGAGAMGRKAGALAAVAGLALALAACGDKGGSEKAPTGQVVARLNGTDITLLEVNAELAGAQIPPNVTRKEAEQAALQNIVMRRMMMNAAKERKLDQSPQFKLQERRMSEQLLVQALARDIAGKVPEATREEADKFIAENPAMFEERTIYRVDQIQFPRTQELASLPLGEAKTMEAVEAVLRNAGIEFRRQPAELDLRGANPRFVAEITKLLSERPKELFMFPAPVGNGQIMLVNQVTSSQVMPFVGERARELAKQMVRQQRIQEALAAEAKKQQEAVKTAVTYQEGYAPPEGAKPALPDPLTGGDAAITGDAAAAVPPAAALPPAEAAPAQ